MPDLQTLAGIAVVLIVVCLVLSVIFHMFRAVIVLGVLLITIPILCTIMWGDGEMYVSKVASLFTQEIEQQINDGYKAYHDANAEDPVVDLDQLESYMDQFMEKAKEQITGESSTQVFPDR